MKRLISIMLTVAMVLSMLVAAVPASAETALGNDSESASNETQKKATVAANHVPGDFDGDGVTDAGAKKITTVAELKGIASGEKAYLANDLVVTPEDKNGNMVLIGGWFGNTTYLDGCGYTIEFDKNVDTTTQTAVAIFNGTGGTIVIKNLNVAGVMNTTDAIDTHFGVLCKHGGSAVVENVVIDVDVTLNTIKSGTSGAWAKLDGACTAIFKNVHFTGSINANAALTNSYGGLGGFIGERSGSGEIVFENCSNTGTITLSADANSKGIGGFIGTITSGCAGKTTIKNSTSSVNISVGNTQIAYAGGFVGFSGPNITIDNCESSATINFGDVDAESVAGKDFGGNAGGLVGRIAGSHNAEIVAKITNCSNKGNITVNNNPSVSAGGIVGYNSKAYLQIDNCSNSGEIKGRNPLIYGDFNNIHMGLGGIIGTIGNEWSGGGKFETEITHCSNTGKISTFKALDTETSVNVFGGGIVGRIYAATYVYIEDCTNGADIDTSNTEAWSMAGGIVGGIVCYCADSDYTWSGVDSGDIIVIGCTNTGNMTSSRWAAGIIAAGMQLYADDLNINVSYCINEGEIKAGLDTTLGVSSSAIAGGIVGVLGWDPANTRKQFSNLDITYCVNEASVTAGANALAAGGILGYTYGDSLTGNYNDGTGVDSKAAEQKTAYGITFDYYTQRTWLEQVGNDGAITCQNASGKVGNIAGVIKNKYYLLATYAFGTNTLGESGTGGNAWVHDAGWAAQTGNDNDPNSTCDALASFIKLTNAIRKVENEKLVADGMATDLWATFSNALATAKTFSCPVGNDMRDTDGSKTLAMDNARAALVTARAELKAPDYTALKKAMADISANELWYSASNWEAVQNAIRVAEGYLSATSQSAIDAACEQLINTVAGIDKLDRTVLEGYISEADAKVETAYTTETWAPFAQALATAKALVSRDQDEINRTAQALKSAMDNLAAPDTAKLDEAIDKAGALTETDYTVADWTDILAAIETARGYLTSKSQTAINNAADALTAAVNGKTKLDRTALVAALNEAEAKNELAYTTESWSEFATVKANAKEALNSRVQADIDAAAQALEAAMDDLAAPDFTALNELLAEASTYKAEDYNSSAWFDFEDAYADAQMLTSERSQATIDAMVERLNQAINALEGIDRAVLDNAIAAAKALTETDYTVDDWAAIQSAIATATEYLTSRVQDDINDAAADLNEAVNGKTKLDRSALQGAIAAADGKVENNYTTETWATFAAALADAQAKLASRVQADINAAATALNNAIDALRAPDYTALNAAIANSALDKDEYTEGTWEALETALALANSKLTSRTQSDIDAAVTVLNNAIAGLEKIPAAPGEPGDDPVEEPGDEPSDEPTTEEPGDEPTTDDPVEEPDGALDFSVLEEAISEAEKLNSADYTESSWAKVAAAVVNAKKILSSAEDQEKIDAALVALDDAIEALVEASAADNSNDDTDADTDDDDEIKDIKGGCGSVIAASTAVLATVMVLGFGLKKKED